MIPFQNSWTQTMLLTVEDCSSHIILKICQLTLLSFCFSLAFSSSSSRYVRTPILQSITQHGLLKSLKRSWSWRYWAEVEIYFNFLSNTSWNTSLHSSSSPCTRPLNSGTYGRITSFMSSLKQISSLALSFLRTVPGSEPALKLPWWPANCTQGYLCLFLQVWKNGVHWTMFRSLRHPITD